MIAFLLALCLAADPKAVIEGPSQANPGDLVILDATKSAGTGHVWKLVGSKKSYLPVNGGTQCVFASGDAGVYTFVLAVADGGKASLAEHSVTVGTPPPPIPVPPPTPPPDPTPPPKPPGLRTVMIVQETGDKTPQWSMTLNQLRTGVQSQYLKDKGHSLLIIDADSLSGDAKWKALLQGMTLPVLVISDGKTHTLVHKQSVTHAMTADEFVTLLKEKGG